MYMKLGQARVCGSYNTANAILASLHDCNSPPPTVGQNWAAQRLRANPQRSIRK